MKKIGASVFLFFFVISLLSLTFAANTTNTSSSTNASTTTSTSSSSTDDETAGEKIDKAFTCLENKAADCSKLSNQELALTIMATPADDVFDDCVKVLKSRRSSNNWGTVRDTALAILALDHAGEDTEASEKWLLSKAKNPTDLTWYLEQDSNEEVNCNVKYDAKDYDIQIDENKKIDKNAGSCLTRAQSNFWLKITPECLDKKFQVECDQNFITALLYKDKSSPTIYVLDNTQSAQAFGSVEMEIKSKCFGDSSSCDYEGTAWATIALLELGYDVEEYIPYVIAMSDSNKRYLPDAFIYALTSYEDYATKLIENQKIGKYWEADSSAYNRYYDTSIALLSVGTSSSSEKVQNAKDYLLYAQGQNGCWQNSIRDTAIVLWAIEGRGGRIGGDSSSGGSEVTYCSEANFFCIPQADCPTAEDVGDNYFCSSLSTTCCKSENLKTCSEYGGKKCETGLVCSGNQRKSSDETACCTGECKERSDETECESMFFSCKTTCSDGQVQADYACDGSEVCCKSESGADTTKKNYTWLIWTLVILIVLVLGAIIYIKREELKLWLFKTKTGFKKDKGGPTNLGLPSRPGYPPRPGFPPVRRMPPQVPARRTESSNPEMNETFKKLKEMSEK